MTPTSAFVLLLGGALWGCSFSSSHVNEFAVVRAQLTLSSLIMLKTFLAALTTSTLSFLLLSLSHNPARKQQLDQLRRTVAQRHGRGLLLVRTYTTTSHSPVVSVVLLCTALSVASSPPLSLHAVALCVGCRL